MEATEIMILVNILITTINALILIIKEFIQRLRI